MRSGDSDGFQKGITWRSVGCRDLFVLCIELDYVLLFDVFEVGDELNCACIDVRKRCVVDMISIAHARFIFIDLESMVEVFSGFLNVF